MFPAKIRLRAAFFICLYTGLTAVAGQDHLALRQNPFDPEHQPAAEVVGGTEAVPSLTRLIYDEGIPADLAATMVLEKTARRAGLDVNSVTNRKNRPLPGAEHLEVLRVYLGYDGELPALLNFFDMLEEAGLPYEVESLNISARRHPLTAARRIPRPKSLNGNLIVALHTDGALPASVPADSPFRQTGVIARLVNGLVDVVPDDTHLTSLVKKGEQVNFFGQTTDVEEVIARFAQWDLVEDVISSDAIQSAVQGGTTRFLLRGTLTVTD